MLADQIGVIIETFGRDMVEETLNPHHSYLESKSYFRCMDGGSHVNRCSATSYRIKKAKCER